MKKRELYIQPVIEIVYSVPSTICAGSPPTAGYNDKQNPENPDTPITVDPNPGGDTPPPVGARYNAWTAWDDMDL